MRHIRNKSTVSLGMKFGSLCNSHSSTQELANDYHYKGGPATIVLDGELKLARIFYGLHEMENLGPIIKTLLATKK